MAATELCESCIFVDGCSTTVVVERLGCSRRLPKMQGLTLAPIPGITGKHPAVSFTDEEFSQLLDGTIIQKAFASKLGIDMVDKKGGVSYFPYRERILAYTEQPGLTATYLVRCVAMATSTLKSGRKRVFIYHFQKTWETLSKEAHNAERGADNGKGEEGQGTR